MPPKPSKITRPLLVKKSLKTFNQLPNIIPILKDLRTGPGAIQFPPNISRIECKFSPLNTNTKYFTIAVPLTLVDVLTIRLFWDNYLPKIAFNNNHIDIKVTELTDGKDEEITTIFSGISTDIKSGTEKSSQISIPICPQDDADSILKKLAQSSLATPPKHQLLND